MVEVKPRGRPPKKGFKKSQIRSVCRRVVPVYPSCASLRAALARYENVSVSKQTVFNDLRALNLRCRVRPLHPVPEINRAARFFFVSHFRSLDSFQFLFSDEKIFCSNDYTCRSMWVKEGEQVLPRERSRYPQGRCQVWACIGFNFVCFHIFPIEERITQEVYKNKCLTLVLDHLRKNKHLFFQQDNASSHNVAHSFFFSHLKRRVLMNPAWASNSPDLNPIEQFWAMLNARVSNHHPMNAKELRLAIEEEFRKLTFAEINSFVFSFKEKCEKCFASRGGSF